MPQHNVKTCVIPAAGLGTRFLPATKAVPKEMLPIVDKPTLQYIVEEVAAAGIKKVVLVNGRGKSCLEDHFDIAVELEAVLEARGKKAEKESIRAITKLAQVVSVRQLQPLGLGHAVLCAKELVGGEPFGVILGDDLVDATVPAIEQLALVNAERRLGVIALMPVEPDQTHLYGIAEGERVGPRTIRIRRLVEKPKPGSAPSNLAVIGRYLLPPRIFDYLEKTAPGVGGEIQLTDGLAELARNEGLLGYEFEGQRYDAGEKVGYLKANIAFALKREELRAPLLAWLRGVVK